MAVKYYTAASGNWSTAGNWNGGAVPQAGDDVYANGKTVTIDTNIAVTKISSEVCPDTSVGGGEFRFTADRTVACNIVAGSTQCVQIATAGVTISIVGSVYGGSGASARAIYLNQATITLNITGNVYGGSGSVGAYGIVHGSIYTAITINVFGSVYGGSGSRGIVLLSGVVNVTGYVYADNLSAIVADTVTVNGETWGSSSVAAIVEYTSGSGTVNIAGLVYNASSKMAIVANRITMSSSSLCGWRFYDPAITPVMLYATAALENAPSESDVRLGVIYGIGNAYTGTLNPGATASEIVAAIEASELGTKILASAQTSDIATVIEAIEAIPTPDPGASPAEFVQALKDDSLGQRLSNCSTVATTGAQIAGATPPEA